MPRSLFCRSSMVHYLLPYLLILLTLPWGAPDWAPTGPGQHDFCRSHLSKLCSSCLLAPDALSLSPSCCMEWRRTQGSRLTTHSLEPLKGFHFNNLLGNLGIINLSGYFLLCWAATFLGVFYINISGGLGESNHINLQ